MTNPTRIQRSRQRKQASPNGLPIKYVGRPTKLGNPFKVGERVPDEYFSLMTKHDKHYFTKGKPIYTRQEAVYLFEKYRVPQIMKEITELKDQNLSCWCRVGDCCHADVLLKIANG